MLRHRFIALIGSFTLTSLLVMLVLQLTAQAVDGEALPAHSDNAASVLLGELYPIGRSAATSSTLSCREGLAGREPYLSQGFDIQLLGGGIYLDFNAHVPSPQPNAMEFIQVIRVRQDKTAITGTYLSSYKVYPPLIDTPGGLGQIIADAPGSLWLVGNEPDRGPNLNGSGAQDDTYPEIYAEAYHDVYTFIKERDPSALVGNAGLVEVTPGRLQYLDKMWNAYARLYGTPIPVDVWNMHIYILPETDGIANVALGTDPALAYIHNWVHTPGEPAGYTYGDHDNLAAFDVQVRLMRQWMKQHGQQDKPLLLSEFGVLYGEGVTDEFGATFTVPRAATFLTKTFNYLTTASDAGIGMPSDGNRLVQQWVWFSANNNYGVGYLSNLITDTSPLTLTTVGKMFQANVGAKPLTANLLPRVTGSSPLITMLNGATVTATLFVQIVNNGNRSVTTPFTVTFYANAALTETIGSTVISSGIPGCARRRVTADVEWPNLGVGVHAYWVKVDSSDAIAETSEADNIIFGQALVGTQQQYLPLVSSNFP